MSTLRVQATKDYRLFESQNPENRVLEPGKHKKLLSSLRRYGFLSCFPIVVVRTRGRLIIKEGQHRAYFAEMLGLPIYFVVTEEKFDIAEVNSTPRQWAVGDYAKRYAATGHKQYQEAIEFANGHRLPLGIAFALLGGTTSFGNIEGAVKSGEWKIKDRGWAESVAGVYGPMVMMDSALRNVRFLQACMAICRVDGFDANRLLSNARRCREKLLAYSTRDAYLDMIEEVYNYGRKQLVGLKTAALMALRERSPIGHGKKPA